MNLQRLTLISFPDEAISISAHEDRIWVYTQGGLQVIGDVAEF